MNFTVAALYRFTPLTDLPETRRLVQDICAAHDICGTLLLAPEGFNGTIAGTNDALNAALAALDPLLGFRGAEVKFSSAAARQ